MWDMQDMVRLIRLVQWGEEATELYDKTEALEALCREVRALVEQEAELGGRYAELMVRIGEDG